MTKQELASLQAWAHRKSRGAFTLVPRVRDHAEERRVRRILWREEWRESRPAVGSRQIARRLARKAMMGLGLWQTAGLKGGR